MLDVLLEFEQTAAGLRPVVLIVPGLALVMLGLFMWLGGLGIRRAGPAMAGVVVGGTLGYFVIGRNVGAAAILAVVCALSAVVVEKVFVMVTLAAMVLLVGLFVFASVYGELPEGAVGLPEVVVERIPTETIAESLEQLRAFVAELLSSVWEGTSAVPVYGWLGPAAAVAVVVVLGLLLKRVAAAVCCSMLGCMMMSCGMGMLLLYKGSSPLSRVAGRAGLYGAVLLGMTVFGAVIQLVLCGRREAAVKRADKGKAQDA